MTHPTHESTAPSAAERLAREFMARVWGPEHDLDAIDELMAEDYAIQIGRAHV
jgi:predicted RNase H-like nuclease (RuvC/YqgF family)